MTKKSKYTPMNLKGVKIKVHDMSLRDGMHPKRHLITIDQMKTISRGLDEAGVPLIEVTHGDGLGGASVNYGFPAASDEEYLRAVIPGLKKSKVSALLLPGIGTVDHLRMAKDCGVHTIRVATHCTEASISRWRGGSSVRQWIVSRMISGGSAGLMTMMALPFLAPPTWATAPAVVRVNSSMFLRVPGPTDLLATVATISPYFTLCTRDTA